MMWQIFVIAAAVISSSDGCSRLCPCRREIENITQRLDSLEDLKERFISQAMGTLKKINKNVDQLMKSSADNMDMGKALAGLTARVEDMAFEIQDVKGGSNCTDDEVEDPVIEENPGTEDSPKKCPPGWVSFGGSCYYFQLSKVHVTQEQANIQCESRYNGSSLVAIETIGEYNFLKKNLSAQYSSIRSRTTNGWLTSGKKIGNTWTWEPTGAPLNFTVLTWAAKQPNGQSCLSLWPSSSFNIADVYCTSYERQFICEI